MDTERLQLNDVESVSGPLLNDPEPEISALSGELDGEVPDSEPELRDETEDDLEDEDVEDRHEEDDDQVRTLGGSYSEAPPADLEGLVHYVVSKLVSDPEAIEISSEQRGGTMYIALRVPETDLGRVIGREGRTAKAIRTLVSIAGSKSNVHARLDIDG